MEDQPPNSFLFNCDKTEKNGGYCLSEYQENFVCLNSPMNTRKNILQYFDEVAQKICQYVLYVDTNNTTVFSPYLAKVMFENYYH